MRHRTNPAAAAGATIGLTVLSDRPVEATIEMFRPAKTVSPQALRSNPAGSDIEKVAFEPSDNGGRLRITVPSGQAPGTYHGLLLAEPDGTPAGAVTLKILPPDRATP